ncbi:DUF551 domain-containing protein [Klebsiella pneumoniae]|nr:DUF551 domain-containing protein [Klebsiella pneumoniae]
MASRQTAFESAREEILADLQLAELALAAMASEPVAVCIVEDGQMCPDGFGVCDHSLPDGTHELYAAPQPAPVVPDEMTIRDACKFVQDMRLFDDVSVIVMRTWNACRAAMLAAAPHDTPALNSLQSVDSVTGGWIPVSERMPEMGEKQRYVLAADFKNNYWPNIPNTQVGVYGDWFDDGNPTWDDGDGEDLHLKEVTHWMPLPAAPQEVKGE